MNEVTVTALLHTVMARRMTSGTCQRLPVAVLAFPWIPLIRAQALSLTTDSSTPPSSFSTSISAPSYTSQASESDSRHPQSSTSTSRLSSSTLSVSPTIPDFIASSNPTAAPPPQTSKQIQQENQDDGLVNSYFAILALLILFLLLGMWALHRRKKRAKARRISSRREALARDLDGWTGRDGNSAGGNGQSGLVGRYWGHWRNWSEGYARREEGLNERGEAPPAYSPRAVPEEGTQPAERRGGEDQHSTQLQIPLRTLSREEVPGLKPPEYIEMVRATSPESEEGVARSAGSPRQTYPESLARDGPGAPSR